MGKNVNKTKITKIKFNLLKKFREIKIHHEKSRQIIMKD